MWTPEPTDPGRGRSFRHRGSREAKKLVGLSDHLVVVPDVVQDYITWPQVGPIVKDNADARDGTGYTASAARELGKGGIKPNLPPARVRILCLHPVSTTEEAVPGIGGHDEPGGPCGTVTVRLGRRPGIKRGCPAPDTARDVEREDVQVLCGKGRDLRDQCLG